MKTRLTLAALTLAVSLNAADNWPQFRGPEALGVSDNPDLPDKWGPTENALWKRDVPGRGWSSPVVWGNRVFLTTAINESKTEEPKKGLYFGGNRSAAKTIHRWKVLCLNLDDGKILWEKLARKGKTVEREAKPIHIYSYEFSEYTEPTARFRVHCTKGTYVRSLAHELGQRLECGAHLSALHRTQSGNFNVADATRLEDLVKLPAEALPARMVSLLDIARMFLPAE